MRSRRSGRSSGGAFPLAGVRRTYIRRGPPTAATRRAAPGSVGFPCRRMTSAQWYRAHMPTELGDRNIGRPKFVSLRGRRQPLSPHCLAVERRKSPLPPPASTLPPSRYPCQPGLPDARRHFALPLGARRPTSQPAVRDPTARAGVTGGRSPADPPWERITGGPLRMRIECSKSVGLPEARGDGMDRSPADASPSGKRRTSAPPRIAHCTTIYRTT